MTAPLDRPSAVLLLLDSLLDYVPAPKSATGQLAASGPPVVEQTKQCPRCSGTGKEIVERWDDGRRKQVTCGDCSGGGVLVTGHTVAESSASRGLTAHELDDEIGRLERSQRDRKGERSERDAYGWERERARARRAGSYADLERALEWLRDVAPGRYRLAWRVIYHEPWMLDAGMVEALGETLEMLAERMPARIRVPDRLFAGSVALEAGGRLDSGVREARDAAIRRDRAAGVPLAMIADRYAVSRSRVSQVTATTMGATG